MTSEVIIDVKEKEISIALLEDKDLVEYQTEPRSASFSVGNVYVAKVRKIMPGLNACFVDVGFEKDAFLHYLDMGQHFNSYAKYIKQVNSDHQHLMPFEKAQRMPDLEKDGSVAQALTVGQEVLVQIVKDGYLRYHWSGTAHLLLHTDQGARGNGCQGYGRRKGQRPVD